MELLPPRRVVPGMSPRDPAKRGQHRELLPLIANPWAFQSPIAVLEGISRTAMPVQCGLEPQSTDQHHRASGPNQDSANHRINSAHISFAGMKNEVIQLSSSGLPPSASPLLHPHFSYAPPQDSAERQARRLLAKKRKGNVRKTWLQGEACFAR